MHRLVYGAALEEVVALVGAAPGVEEREHAGDQERRLVVRDGVGTREDRGCLPVFAVRVCEKERFGRREGLVQPAALAHEAAFDDRPVVDVRLLGGDEVIGLDVHADMRPVADGAVFEHRRPVDAHFVADADFADEFRAYDAGVAAYAAHLRRTRFGIGLHHAFQRRNGLRPVAVDGHQIGYLRRHPVEYPDRAAPALVHRRYAHAVAERAPAAAFESRDALYERALADPVVAYARSDDARAGADLDRPLQMALQQLEGREIFGDPHLRPCFGRRSEGFGGGNLRRSHISELRHRCRIKQMQI